MIRGIPVGRETASNGEDLTADPCGAVKCGQQLVDICGEGAGGDDFRLVCPQDLGKKRQQLPVVGDPGAGAAKMAANRPRTPLFHYLPED
jgi:hypothetical protein